MKWNKIIEVEEEKKAAGEKIEETSGGVYSMSRTTRRSVSFFADFKMWCNNNNNNNNKYNT